MRLVSTFCASLLLLSSTAHAAAWTLPEGDGQLIVNAFYYSTDSYDDTRGREQSQPRFSKYEINPYVEYGLGDGTTVGFSTFLHQVTQDMGGQDSNWGMADTEIFLRRRLYQDDTYALALQPVIKLPSAYAHGGLPRAGSDEWDGEINLQGGMNFDAFGNTHYVTLETGYRKRFGAPGDQVRAALTLGLRVSERWTVLPQLSGIFRTDEASGAAAFTQSSSDDYNLVKGQLSALYSMDNGWGVQVGGFGHLWTENTGNGGGAMVAVWKQF